ncbi:MAG: biopolymer transporter ExbD [Gammaproteobacteria bacterium]|nr:biopolymer transporter ExbD [Gammaproteobacteria bacterium]
MKVSRRAQRMRRHYARMHRTGGLNLVSLMDIFTILVFFLMVNSSDVKVLEPSPQVRLPESVAEGQPDDSLVVTITPEHLMVQGRSLARLAELSPDDRTFAVLREELLAYKSRLAGELPEEGLPVTVMADRRTHYALLRKVMATCVEADFRKVRLAVNRESKAEGQDGGQDG